MAERHTGRCYCGAVEVEATGEPLDMGYCHCNECRRYCTAPVSIFTLWKPETVKISQGVQFLGKFHASELSDRRYCTKCGGHVMIDHPTLGLADIRVPLSNFTFKPTMHLANAPRFDVLFYFVQNSVEFTTRHIALHLLVPFVIVPAVQPRRKLSPLFERESLDRALDFSQTH